MADVVDGATRSRMMSGIRGKDTAPELAVRRYLHAAGYRFRLHGKGLPGSPDIVMKKHRLVIFVHGCFWHRHPGCFYATSPATRKDFWQNKLTRNAQRDEEQQLLLAAQGWRVLVVWECGIKHALDRTVEIIDFIAGEDRSGQWPSTPPRMIAISSSAPTIQSEDEKLQP